MQSLKDLTFEAPLHDLEGYVRCLVAESDRSAAIMAAAFLERALYVLINCSIADWGETRRNEWFDSPNAPFRSFSAKIVLGQAIFLYSEETAQRLHRIRNIRNTFAHAAAPIDFQTPAIANETRALYKGELPKSDKPEKTRFCSTCVYWANQFLKVAQQESGKERETMLP